MSGRRLLGVGLLVICAALVAVPVFAGFSMAGVHTGMVIVSGLAGTVLVIS